MTDTDDTQEFPAVRSYLTEAEVESLQSIGLSRKTPFVIRDVSRGFFSVARHYGSASYNGSHYVYCQPTDELIRDDVLKWIAERRKEQAEKLNAQVRH